MWKSSGYCFFIALFVTVLELGTSQYNDDPVTFCYYSSTAQYRRGQGRFIPEDIDTDLCTHVIFAFANIVNGRYLQAANREHLSGTDGGLYARTIALKRINPNLKVLLAVGGWAVGSEPFVAILSSDANRRAFVRNTVRFLRRHKFDGLDMDWEFPGVRGSQEDDKYRFTSLMKELQEAFQEETRRSGREKMLLTLAAAGGTYFINKAYEPRKLVNYVDYLLVMAYNYHGSWNDYTGHHSGLLPRADELGGERQWNQAWTIDYWLSTGISPRRIVVGIPTYGMSFTLAEPSQHGLRSPASGAGAKGKYTQEPGILSYYETCENLDNGWHSVWIEEQKSPYAYKGDQWVGYDNLDSVGYKARYARDKGLGGAFIWSVEMDDFRGTCGSGKYPLLNTIAGILRGESDGPTNQRTRKRVITRRRKIRKPVISISAPHQATVSLSLPANQVPDVYRGESRDQLRSRESRPVQYEGETVHSDRGFETSGPSISISDYDDYDYEYPSSKQDIRRRSSEYEIKDDPKTDEAYSYYDYEDGSSDVSKIMNFVGITRDSRTDPADLNQNPSIPLRRNLQERDALTSGFYDTGSHREGLLQKYDSTASVAGQNIPSPRSFDYNNRVSATNQRALSENELANQRRLHDLNRQREQEQLEQQQQLQQQQLFLQKQLQKQQQLVLQQKAFSLNRNGGSVSASLNPAPRATAGQSVGHVQDRSFQQAESLCQGEGLFPHPDSCSAYYICVKHGDRMYNFLMHCPANLGFKRETGDCGYDATCR